MNKSVLQRSIIFILCICILCSFCPVYAFAAENQKENLAGNAVKYNRRGGKVILYFNEISSDDKTAVFEFVCSDTGLGMSEEFQKHAFESYAREGKETTNGYSGAGLGLSIVKDIVSRSVPGRFDFIFMDIMMLVMDGLFDENNFMSKISFLAQLKQKNTKKGI